METTVYQIELLDGRIWRIFCANKSQKIRVHKSYHKFSHLFARITEITNGIHTVSQWEKIIKNL